MAILKKSQVSGSLIIGSGSEATQWYEDDNSGSQYGKPYVSSPMYTGSGFAFRQGYENTIPLGYYPVNSNLSGKNIKETLETAFNFTQPVVDEAVDAVWSYSNSTDNFIVPATSDGIATVTWNTTYQMPAYMESTIIGFSCSPVTLTYKDYNNIDFENGDDQTNYMHFSAPNVTNTTKTLMDNSQTSTFYYMQEVDETPFGGYGITYSVNANLTTVPSISIRPYLYVKTSDAIKDILGNTVTNNVTSKYSSNKTTTNYQRYGVRFILARKDGSGGNQFKATTATGTITPIGNWETYENAFSASVPYLKSSSTGAQKDWIMDATCFDGGTGERPISVLLLCYDTNDLYDTHAGLARFGTSGDNRFTCKTLASVNSADTIDHTGISLNNTYTSDLALAFSETDGQFSKTWANGLSSGMKMVYVVSTDPRTTPLICNYYA